MKKETESGKILVVDDDSDVLYTARLALRGIFEKVDVLDSPDQIPLYLKRCMYDVIILDMNFSREKTSGNEGIYWLEKILKIDQDACVMMTTAYGEINQAVRAMKIGAVDFLIKPWDREQLVVSAANALNKKHRKKDIGSTKESHGRNSGPMDSGIISRSSAMAEIRKKIKIVGPTDASVLIMGENGTGKELIAKELHNCSNKKNGPFVHVDLGAVPETLFEAELFGHTKGAFTGAVEERAGRFESAAEGTLFLDEIGNLTLPLQAKLLTALQSHQTIRIGSNKPVHTNVRFISATNMPLYEMSDSFQFRQDLLYRINTVEIIVPPLRERKEDIEPIAEHYLSVFMNEYNKHGLELNEKIIKKLLDYNWPGNVRELAHCVERAIIFNKNGKLSPDDFEIRMRSAQKITPPETVTSVGDYEKVAINRALEKYKGNLSKAAEELGIARSTLYRKISQM